MFLKLSIFIFVSKSKGVVPEMETRKLLSSFCYFSVFFSWFLFPLVVYFASGDKDTKSHAKKAFLSHLIILIPVPFIIYSANVQAVTEATDVSLLFIISVTSFFISGLIVIVWNIVTGIKVLIK